MIEIGSLVDGKYKILSEIGHGGMSVVYMALNEKANKTWAVKEVRKDGKMDFNTVRQGLMAEIETLKKLDHPNLPSIVDVIEDDESFIIVMDYIQGRSLDKIIDESGAQPESFVVEWAKQLCDVFKYLHTRTPPIIYRDMKPANVMLKPDGNVTVIDFGTAKNFEIDLGQTTGIGTIGYAAPEQYINSGLGRTDPRTDIYCLGITLYHLLTDVDPCKNLITDKSIRAINPALSPGLDAIIQKCTQEHPDNRYQSCEELMYDLEHYKDLEPIYKKKQKRKLFSTVAMFGLSVACCVAGITCNAVAASKASETYDIKLDEADKATDYSQKVKLYSECIEITDMGGRKDAYEGLIKTFKDDDAICNKDEFATIDAHIRDKKDFIKADPQVYCDLCVEVGKLLWYYYDDGSNTKDKSMLRATNSIPWFKDAMSVAEENGLTLDNMVIAYYNIGYFYQNVDKMLVEAADKGMYKEFFNNLSTIVKTIAVDENESEIVRIRLLSLTQNALHKYATKFKVDGVSEKEITTLCKTVSNAINNITTTTESTDAEKNAIINLLPDTLEAIELAYGKNKGGNE